VPNTAATAAIAPTTRTGGPPWIPVLWTATWPFPRLISQRLTGNAMKPAITRATERAPQKSASSTPACIAPGIATMIALSTISIVAMLNVSDASAIGMTALNARPARRSGRLVRA
jgi:hypothetical protein